MLYCVYHIHRKKNNDFEIDDMFWDSEELKTTWQTTRMSDVLLLFELNNTNRSLYLHSYCNSEKRNGNERMRSSSIILKT